MIKLIERIGRFYSSLVVTITVLILAQAITSLAYMATNQEISLGGRISSLANPLIITPFISWWFMGLLLKIRKLEQEMRVLATYDNLTGLYNRNSYFDISNSILSLMKREKQPLTALYIDVDYFKNLNDAFGHNAGDIALKKFGTHLSKNLRSGDVAGRIGGEEFAVTLPNTKLDGGKIIAEKLRQGIAGQEITLNDGFVIKITVSIGVSSYSAYSLDEKNNFDRLLKNADEALYQAKESGRNIVITNEA